MGSGNDRDVVTVGILAGDGTLQACMNLETNVHHWDSQREVKERERRAAELGGGGGEVKLVCISEITVQVPNSDHRRVLLQGRDVQLLCGGVDLVREGSAGD